MTVGGVNETVISELLYQRRQKTLRAGIQVERDKRAVLHGRGGAARSTQLPSDESTVVFDVVALGLGHGSVFGHGLRSADGLRQPLA